MADKFELRAYCYLDRMQPQYVIQLAEPMLYGCIGERPVGAGDEVRVAQQPAEAICRARRRMNEKPGMVIVHLERNPAARAADHRLALPQRLGHGEPEPFFQGLLHTGRCWLQASGPAVRASVRPPERGQPFRD